MDQTATQQRIAALPCWRGAIEMEPLAGGLSNESWLVRDEAGWHVARFGLDFPFHHVSRERELEAARAAWLLGFAPPVEFAAPGVMVSAYIEGRSWTEAEMRENPESIALLLADFHRRMPAEVRGPAYLFWVFHVIREYGRTLEAAGSPWLDRLGSYLAASVALEEAQTPLPLIFGHNDLLPGNFLDDGKRLWLIDYEYAGFGTAMFDLAGAASNSGMDETAAAALLEAYFGARPGPELRRSFAAMQCSALLREAMWGMVSRLHLSAPGVDYDAYARENLKKLDAALDRYQSAFGKIVT